MLLAALSKFDWDATLSRVFPLRAYCCCPRYLSGMLAVLVLAPTCIDVKITLHGAVPRASVADAHRGLETYVVALDTEAWRISMLPL